MVYRLNEGLFDKFKRRNKKKKIEGEKSKETSKCIVYNFSNEDLDNIKKEYEEFIKSCNTIGNSINSIISKYEKKNPKIPIYYYGDDLSSNDLIKKIKNGEKISRIDFKLVVGETEQLDDKYDEYMEEYDYDDYEYYQDNKTDILAIMNTSSRYFEKEFKNLAKSGVITKEIQRTTDEHGYKTVTCAYKSNYFELEYIYLDFEDLHNASCIQFNLHLLNNIKESNNVFKNVKLI